MPGSVADAWDEFCEALAMAGRDFLSDGYPRDEIALAHGYHHLGSLLEQALRWHLDADPHFPRFVTLNDTFEFADNRFAPVMGGASYRLNGNASTLFDLNISLHEGWAFTGQPKVWGNIGLADLNIEPDGSFELNVSPKPHGKNRIELPATATMVHIREYFRDWDTDCPGSFEIVRIGSEGHAPQHLNPKDLARRLADVIRWVHGYTPTHMQLIDRLRAQPPNRMQPPSRQSFGNSNIVYTFGRFALDDGVSLILEFPEPQARLWGVQWLTTPWYENPDLANRSTSVGGKHAFVDADGCVRIVVSALDPGVTNWLDIGGHAEGILAARWIWTSTDGPAIASTVVASEDIRSALPADTPIVDATQRAAMQKRRRAHFARRRR